VPFQEINYQSIILEFSRTDPLRISKELSIDKPMISSPWHIYFSDQLTNWNDPEGVEPGSMESLELILRAGFIGSEAYLAWAQDSYELPLLNDKFYELFQPNTPLWLKWKDRYSWNSSLIPIAVWESHLLIACLAPPENFPAEWNPVFVLSSQSSLNKLWHQLNPLAKTPHSPLSPLIAPKVSTLISQLGSEIVPDTERKPVIPSHRPSDEFDPRALEESLGMTDENSEGDENSEKNSAEPPEKLQLEIDLDDSLSEKTLTSLSDLSAGTLTLARPAETKQSKTSSKPTIIESPPQVEPLKPKPLGLNAILKKDPSEETAPIASIPKATPQKFSNTFDINMEDSKVGKPQYSKAEDLLKPPLPITIKGPTKTKSEPSVLGNLDLISQDTFLLNFLMKKFHSQIIAAFDNAFDELHGNFKKCAVLAVNQSETEIKFIYGNQEVKAPRNRNFIAPLKEPSIFSIVNRTLKPYHGYIVVNTINENFFDEILDGNLPEHVTMYPLILEDQLVGMLFGAGEKSCYNRNILQQFQTTSDHLSHKIQEIKKSMELAS